jgi:two-component system sensor histidine kinase UhpB
VHPLFVALIRDLSHEHALEGEVASLSRRLDGLLETDADRHLALRRRPHHLCQSCSPCPRRRQTRGELAGRHLGELLAAWPHAALQTQIDAAARGQSTATPVDCTLLRADGEPLEVEIRTSAVPGLPTAVQMFIADVTPRRRQQRHERERRLELRRLSANHVDAREDERRHLARELHDELGQRLSALKMSLQQPGNTTADAVAMVDQMVVAMRRIATNLRPLMLDDLGLDAAIETLAAKPRCSWASRSASISTATGWRCRSRPRSPSTAWCRKR